MDKLKTTKRYSANLKLLFKLSTLIQENPELRFSQILNNYGFTRTVRPVNPETSMVDWVNDFYLESEDLLERVQHER